MNRLAAYAFGCLISMFRTETLVHANAMQSGSILQASLKIVYDF